MTRPSVASRICDLCQEISLGGTAVTGSCPGTKQEAGYSRLIRRTSVVDVLAGLGAVIPGYVLLMPWRHVRSIGELTALEMSHVFDAAWKMADRVVSIFGGSVVLVEHGSSGHEHGPSGACIDHAHIHLFPLDAGISPALFEIPGTRPIDDLTELNALARRGKNYYYCASDRAKGHLAVEPRLISQQARRIWAKAVGRQDEWDWAAFPFLANAQLTANRLSRDKLSFEEADLNPGDAELNETLNAYSEAAGWYASHTSTFPEKSSLRDEMDWLADHTDGLILDAGAGGGRDAAYLAGLERPVIALDASAPLLAYAPQHKNIRKVVGDVRKLLIESNSIGAVWCSAVLLHLGRDDVLRALREFFRVLRRGGLAEVSVKEGTGHASSPLPGYPRLRRHFFFYEGDDLKQLARLAGLEVVRTWTEEEVDSALVVQRWVKVLLRKPPK
jgi:SAM-dependent methyltransferase/diadenosine tetraphosphate (Ap4A) HIT family hydrolase